MDYATLLRRTSFALMTALIAVLFCYFWIDRPVAFFVHRHHLDEIKFFRWLTYPPPELQTWSPLLLTLLLEFNASSILPVGSKTWLTRASLSS
jgi:hypothetical protein